MLAMRCSAETPIVGKPCRTAETPLITMYLCRNAETPSLANCKNRELSIAVDLLRFAQPMKQVQYGMRD